MPKNDLAALSACFATSLAALTILSAPSHIPLAIPRMIFHPMSPQSILLKAFQAFLPIFRSVSGMELAKALTPFEIPFITNRPILSQSNARHTSSIMPSILGNSAISVGMACTMPLSNIKIKSNPSFSIFGKLSFITFTILLMIVGRY